MEKFDLTKKEIVCIILVKENDELKYGNGFYIDKKTILTTARLLWKSVAPKVTARRSCNNTFLDVKVVCIDNSLNMAMLEVIKDPKIERFGNLAIDGTLDKGNEVYTFASAPGCHFTFINGFVGCSTPDIFLESSTVCGYYHYMGAWETLGYRRMGCYWNAVTLEEGTIEEDFEFGLQPELLVIPCKDMDFHTSCEGSPLFKLNGEIVGIFVESQSSDIDENDSSSSDGSISLASGGFKSSHKIALHVSVIRKFLEDFRKFEIKSANSGNSKGSSSSKKAGRK